MIKKETTVRRGHQSRLTVTAAAISTLATAALAGTALAQDTTLRVAMGSPGEAGIAVFDDVKAQFEAAHPGVAVEMIYQEDDQYQTIGLPTLLAGQNAPDIFFEWTGSRMDQRAADGYAADLTDAVTSGPLAGIVDDEAVAAATLDDKVVLMPHTAEVSNVLWYNVPLLAEHDVDPPTTWDELLAACDTLSAAGVTPIAVGNRDLWPGGNWLSHLASRVVGEDVYRSTLAASGPFSTPEWEQAFGYIAQLAEHRCVNESANAIDDVAGTQLFFQGEAAMHPLGAWFVSLAIEGAPDLDYDFVNLPAMPEGSAGDQGSVIGVFTGHMVNAKSPNPDLAAEYLALMNTPDNVQKFIEAGILPLAAPAGTTGVDERSARLNDLLNEAQSIVLPPDTAYDVEMANELYAAEAAVLGGQATPAEALAALDDRLAR
jgi:raffinose/stachyose/melibiose transport system substrate-binding protein